MIRWSALSIAAIAGCWSTAHDDPHPVGPVVDARPAVDLARARDLVEHQRRASIDPDDAAAAMRATFAPDATIMPAAAIPDDDPGIASAYLGVDPHEQVTGTRVAALAGGGTADAIWVAFVAETDKQSFEPATHAEHATVFVSELFTAASGWKAVALARSQPLAFEGRRVLRPIAGATAPGPLAAIVVDPEQVATSLAPDAVVVVARDRATTAVAARALLRALPAMTLVDRPREVHAAGNWGFVQANLARTGTPTFTLAAQLIAHREHDTWAIVSAHYIP